MQAKNKIDSDDDDDEDLADAVGPLLGEDTVRRSRRAVAPLPVKTGSDEGSDEDDDIMEQDDSDFEPFGEEDEGEEQDESDSEPSAKVVLPEQSVIFALLWSLSQIHHLGCL